jgi:hypothetical protein
MSQQTVRAAAGRTPKPAAVTGARLLEPMKERPDSLAKAPVEIAFADGHRIRAMLHRSTSVGSWIGFERADHMALGWQHRPQVERAALALLAAPQPAAASRKAATGKAKRRKPKHQAVAGALPALDGWDDSDKRNEIAAIASALVPARSTPPAAKSSPKARSTAAAWDAALASRSWVQSARSWTPGHWTGVAQAPAGGEAPDRTGWDRALRRP